MTFFLKKGVDGIGWWAYNPPHAADEAALRVKRKRYLRAPEVRRFQTEVWLLFYIVDKDKKRCAGGGDLYDWQVFLFAACILTVITNK